MSSASACEHLIRMSKHELELFQSQFAKLRRTSRFSSSTPWDRGVGRHSVIAGGGGTPWAWASAWFPLSFGAEIVRIVLIAIAYYLLASGYAVGGASW